MLLAILPAMVFAHPLLHPSMNLLIWIRLMKKKPDNCLSKGNESHYFEIICGLPLENAF